MTSRSIGTIEQGRSFRKCLLLAADCGSADGHVEASDYCFDNLFI